MSEYSFHFDIGNSNVGQIGMCGRVIASNKADALKRFKEQFDCSGMLAVTRCVDEEVVEYLDVYVNLVDGVISEDDIDEVTDIETGYDVDYVTDCPKCGASDSLFVVEANGVKMHSRLEPTGFDVPDEVAVDDHSTTDEKVKCQHCQAEFELAALLFWP